MGNVDLSRDTLLQAVLDTLPEHVAVIDAGGDILMVNEAWRRFGLEQNGPAGGATGVSANYYAACRNATGPSRDEADAALSGIQAVAAGALPRFSLEYVCQTPTETLWFTMTASPLGLPGGGVLVAHTDVSERTRYKTLAYTDALTGVANRRFFATFAAQALTNAAPRTVALIVADLDGFKKVNDGYGHGTGDALLGAFAKRLRAGVREDDLVARLGGDEFAVILPVADLAVLERWLERTLAHLDEPYTLGGRTLYVKASLGVALFPRHGRDLDALMRLADAALYRAKRGGGGAALHRS